MKLFKFGLICTAILLSLSSYAHPAKDVKLSYDEASGLLKMEVVHPVSNQEKHYVEKIEIEVNGEVIYTELPAKQSSKEVHVFEYKLKDVKKGDKVTVQTWCNKFGKKSAKLILE